MAKEEKSLTVSEDKKTEEKISVDQFILEMRTLSDILKYWIRGNFNDGKLRSISEWKKITNIDKLN